MCIGEGPCVGSGAHRGTSDKGGAHEEFRKVGEAMTGEETLMGTAASKGHWREAHRKQSATLMAIVRFRSRSQAWSNWSQVGRVEGW
jgi:hypothetical protein